MRVEALKKENGFFIPFTEELKNITSQKVMLEIKIIQQKKSEEKQARSASDIFGLFRHRKPSKPVSIEDMEAAILERRKHNET